MKISKDLQRLARRLFLLCRRDGAIDWDRVRLLIHRLSELKPRNYLALLYALKSLISIEENKSRTIVTSAYPLPQAEREQLIAALSLRYGKKLSVEFRENPALIAGIHVQTGDHVCDGTVLSRLEQLESLSR